MGTAHGRPGAARPALRAAARPRPAPKSLEKLRFPTTRLDNPVGVAHEVHSPCGGDSCERSPAARGSTSHTGVPIRDSDTPRQPHGRFAAGRPRRPVVLATDPPMVGLSPGGPERSGGAAQPLDGPASEGTWAFAPETAAHTPPNFYRRQQWSARGPIAPRHRAAPALTAPDVRGAWNAPNGVAIATLCATSGPAALRPRRGAGATSASHGTRSPIKSGGV